MKFQDFIIFSILITLVFTSCKESEEPFSNADSDASRIRSIKIAENEILNAGHRVWAQEARIKSLTAPGEIAVEMLELQELNDKSKSVIQKNSKIISESEASTLEALARLKWDEQKWAEEKKHKKAREKIEHEVSEQLRIEAEARLEQVNIKLHRLQSDLGLISESQAKPSSFPGLPAGVEPASKADEQVIELQE